MSDCRAGHYKDTLRGILAARGGLVCVGGFGQSQCDYYEDCMEEFENLKIEAESEREDIFDDG